MSLGIATHQAAAYHVDTQVYAGPLDLLLQLIERAELDITRLALAQVTDQYLEHLRSMEEHSPEEVSAFLVIAARLLQIKSEALLPRPPTREPGEEDPGEALAAQLRAYRRFRRAADFLAQREAKGLHTYLRLAPPVKVEGALDLSGMTLADLTAAAAEIFNRNDSRKTLSTVVAPPKITIRQKIALIAQMLRQSGRISFRVLLNGRKSRLDIIVTFLAMLELVKRRFVRAHQEALFGDIEVEPEEGWNEEEEFELEFGE